MFPDHETTEHIVDRAGWVPGPWDQEPDKVQWRTACGLPGLVVRNSMGALCGYAAVPPGHPLHGLGYDHIEDEIDVHGGLTYSDRCMTSGPVCHVPEPGEPDDVWWFGFDCGHYQDLIPRMQASLTQTPDGRSIAERLVRYASYRPLAYVQAEVERLASQLTSCSDRPRPAAADHDANDPDTTRSTSSHADAASSPPDTAPAPSRAG
jgi:hypothetical protein